MKDEHRDNQSHGIGRHEQAQGRRIQHGEMVHLQLWSHKAWIATDLTGEGDALTGTHESRQRRPRVFSIAPIQLCLSIKVLFKLPLRQAAGMVASLLRLAGLEGLVPHYPTLCRRAKNFEMQIPYGRADGTLIQLVDSIGIKFLGEGWWQVREDDVQGRRRWHKVHLAIDAATSEVGAIEFTASRQSGSSVPLDQIPEDEESDAVTTDGTCHTRRSHMAIIARVGTAIVRIRKVGQPRLEDCPAVKARNETWRAARHYGRAFWKLWTEYQACSRAEVKQRCLKFFGERITARVLDREIAEFHMRVALATFSMRSEPPRSSALPDLKRCGAVTPQAAFLHQYRTNSKSRLSLDMDLSYSKLNIPNTL